ncbi:folylpolyglutamate synthase/dihydrofolate synthase [Rubidibacter lacunae KORDI 51-2]|uniref:tetrahydrofolate synthase n=1 Tax=Rubidibacter lacunae KORDI 51-2 TaxID=582515 RepID=U5DK98_9CHRO|nr:folylpolyglutamate synthase/dihydrofolate synthase [Rubidibacter lacunae KORDI 51-2]
MSVGISAEIGTLLSGYQRFGVRLGLERVQRLLADLGSPQARVPMIHVAGTNGKGSVCAYLSSVLNAAGYRVGRYTSPHLIDWTERISLNERAIAPDYLLTVIKSVCKAAGRASASDNETPTQFEVFTAAAWMYFAEQCVDVAIMEVGLGGRLDATNVKADPLVSAIVSIGRDHWQRLGPTLADIAREKAGVLKPGCPAAIGPLPPAATPAIADRIRELGCPVTWVEPAVLVSGPDRRATYNGIDYSLPLLGKVQLTNSAVAIATLQLLQGRGWSLDSDAIARGLAGARWPGRIQWTVWRDRPLLLDGAHNADAARVLREYVDTLPHPVQWTMGMLNTKDHAEIFAHLLRPGDRLYLVPVPEHQSAAPEELAAIATGICPQLASCSTYDDLAPALDAAAQAAGAIGPRHPTVLCGSLYLLGHFFARNATAYGLGQLSLNTPP